MAAEEKALPKGVWRAVACMLWMGSGGCVRCCGCPVQSPRSEPAPAKPEPTHQAIPAWKRWTVDQVLPSSESQANKKERVLVPCQGKDEKDAIVLSIEGHKIRFCRAP